MPLTSDERDNGAADRRVRDQEQQRERVEIDRGDVVYRPPPTVDRKPCEMKFDVRLPE